MRILLVLAVLVALQGPGRPFPNASTMPACDGDVAIVRVSEIRRKGSIQGFMQAVDAHRAWFRNHGFLSDEIYAARVIVQDKATNLDRYSNSEIMTFHVRPSVAPTRDAAWDAYVKLYRDNSDVKSEYYVCMPSSHGGSRP
jgi:hypothetical protein